MIYLSASLIKDYLVCQKRAYYRTNNSDQSVQTKEMAIGSIVHEAIEKGWDSQVSAIELAHNLVSKYNLQENHYKVFQFLSNYFDMYTKDSFSSDDEIEVFFKIPYQDNVTLVGKMDRIHNGCIYDWKTTKRPPKDLNNDPQFILYYLAYHMMKGEYPNKVVYASLTKKKEYVFEPIPEIIDNFEHRIVPEIINGLQSGFQERNGLEKYRVCDYCAFRQYCFSEMANGR